MPDSIIMTEQDNLMIISLNRPEKLNAIDMLMREELKASLKDAEKNERIRAIVLCGAGSSFSVGGDINSMKQGMPNAGRLRMKITHEVIRQFSLMDKPIVCAVQGYAVGAGFGLALCADVLIAAEGAKFKASAINIGLVPDWGLAYSLPKAIGLPRAKEIILSGRTIEAQEAKAIGFIHKVVPVEQLLAAAIDTAEGLAAKSGLALGLSKSLVNASMECSLEELLEKEGMAQDICMQSSAYANAIEKFLKR
jgi:2-(1,2-epoxy-1,2-dihydrophenyl)acetyl-CoA isomerase